MSGVRTFAQRQAEVTDPDPRYDDIVRPPVFRESLEDEIAERAQSLADKLRPRLNEQERQALFDALCRFGNKCCEMCVERGDARELHREPTREEMIGHAGRLFFRALAWISEAKTLVGLGQRARLMIYVLRPALIGAATLEAMGREMGVTRQRVHALKRELEDTFRGCFPTRTDKPDGARAKCKSTPHTRDY